MPGILSHKTICMMYMLTHLHNYYLSPLIITIGNSKYCLLHLDIILYAMMVKKKANEEELANGIVLC